MPFLGKVQQGSVLAVTVVAGGQNPGASALFVHWDTSGGAPQWPTPLDVLPGGTVAVNVTIPAAHQAGMVEVNVDLPDQGAQAQVTLVITGPVPRTVTKTITADADYTLVIV